MLLTKRGRRYQSARSGRSSTIIGVTLARISWMITVAVLVAGAIIVLLSGYQGYAAVVLAVAAAAAINLF